MLERCCRKTTGWCFSNSFSSLLLSFLDKVWLEEISQRSFLRLSRVAASRWSSNCSEDTCWQNVTAATQRGCEWWTFRIYIFQGNQNAEGSVYVKSLSFKYQEQLRIAYCCFFLTRDWIRIFSLLCDPQCLPHSFNKRWRSLYLLKCKYIHTVKLEFTMTETEQPVTSLCFRWRKVCRTIMSIYTYKLIK